jgi:hypothetical protein
MTTEEEKHFELYDLSTYRTEEYNYDPSTELPEDYEYKKCVRRLRCIIKTKNNRVCKLSAQDERGICHIHLNTWLSHGRTDKYVPYENIGRVQYFFKNNKRNTSINNILINYAQMDTFFSSLFKDAISKLNTKDNEVYQCISFTNIKKCIPNVEEELESFYMHYKHNRYAELFQTYLTINKLYYFYMDLYANVPNTYYASFNIYEDLHKIVLLRDKVATTRHLIETKLSICRQLEKIRELQKDVIYYCIYEYIDADI